MNGTAMVQTSAHALPLPSQVVLDGGQTLQFSARL